MAASAKSPPNTCTNRWRPLERNKKQPATNKINVNRFKRRVSDKMLPSQFVRAVRMWTVLWHWIFVELRSMGGISPSILCRNESCRVKQLGKHWVNWTVQCMYPLHMSAHTFRQSFLQFNIDFYEVPWQSGQPFCVIPALLVNKFGRFSCAERCKKKRTEWGQVWGKILAKPIFADSSNCL